MRSALALLGAALLAGCADAPAQPNKKDEVRPQAAAAQKPRRRGPPMRVGLLVSGVHLSPDGKLALVCYGLERTSRPPPLPGFAYARLWDAATGRELRAFAETDLRVAAFLPDGRTFLYAAADGGLRLLDVRTGREVRRFEAAPGPAAAVAVSADGRRAVSGGEEGPLATWDVATGKRLRTFDRGSGRLLAITLSPDGDLALAQFSLDRKMLEGREASLVRLFDAGGGKALLQFKASEGWWGPMAFSPDTKLAVCSKRPIVLAKGEPALEIPTRKNDLVLWQVPSGRVIRTFPEAANDTTAVLSFVSAGKRLLAASRFAKLKLWDVGSGRELRAVKLGPPVARVRAFSADGRLVAGDSGAEARLYDAATGRLLHNLVPPGPHSWEVY